VQSTKYRASEAQKMTTLTRNQRSLWEERGHPRHSRRNEGAGSLTNDERSALEARLLQHEKVIGDMHDRLQEAIAYLVVLHVQGVGLGGSPPIVQPNASHPTPGMRAPRVSPSPVDTVCGLEKVELNEKGLRDVKQFGGLQSECIHWKERIHSHMSRGKPELGALLIWAQEQPKQITEEVEKGYSLHNIEIDAEIASSMIYHLLGRKVADDMRSKKLKAGAMRGLEFWRLLLTEYEGTSAAV
jgi:hypothetical protein